MIKTVIFDIGNVLTGFRWQEFFKRFGYPEEIYERLCNATVKSRVWHELDRGALSEEEIMDRFIANDPGIEKEIRESLKNIHGMLVRCDYAIPWITELKEKNYRVLVLSNFAKRAGRDCADALDFLPIVDGGILSFQEKLIKPDPAIYRLLLDRYHLKAEECVFLDDTEENVTAAAELGFHAIHFKSYEQAVAELRELGVE